MLKADPARGPFSFYIIDIDDNYHHVGQSRRDRVLRRDTAVVLPGGYGHKTFPYFCVLN